MNLAPLLRQTVEWERQSGLDDRDDPTYQAPETVPCRKVMETKDLISKTGEVVTSRMTVLLLVQPVIGDLLDGREVIQLDACVDYRGMTVGWRARTQ